MFRWTDNDASFFQLNFSEWFSFDTQQQSPSLQFYTLHFTFNVLITRFLKNKATFSFPLRKKETKCLLPFSVTDMKTWFALRTHSQSLSETNSRSMDFYNVYYDINKYLQIPAFKSLFRHWNGFYSRKERKHYKKIYIRAYNLIYNRQIRQGQETEQRSLTTEFSEGTKEPVSEWIKRYFLFGNHNKHSLKTLSYCFLSKLERITDYLYFLWLVLSCLRFLRAIACTDSLD